jgi:hypothetical protein
MNKVEHKIKKEIVTITMKDIPFGTYFYWDEKSGQLFLRTYDGIVSIDNPRSTWDTREMILIGYRPVEVTVKVERFL